MIPDIVYQFGQFGADLIKAWPVECTVILAVFVAMIAAHTVRVLWLIRTGRK
jgi:hypothetical protein